MALMRNPGLDAEQLSSLLERVSVVKELLFYGLFRPRITAEWMNFALVSSEKQLLMQFSSELSGVYFSHGQVDEDDIVAMQTGLYYLKHSLNRKVGILQPQLQLAAPECAAALSDLLQKQESIFQQRYTRLSTEGLLPQIEIRQLQLMIDALRAGLRALRDNFNAGANAPGLSMLMRGVLQAIDDINQQIIQVEESAYGLSQLHVLRTAMTQFVMQGNKNEISHILKEQQELTDILLRHVEAIIPLQKKFLSYLQSSRRNKIFFQQAFIQQSQDDDGKFPLPQQRT